MKKRLIWLPIFFLLAFARPSPAQQPAQANLTAQAASCPSTAGATTSSLIVRVQNTQGGYGIQLSGTWSATVSFFGSANGQTGWSALQVNPISGATGVTTATANGNWQVNSAGLQGVCVLVTTFTSGTVAASITASNASARTNGGSGGGGGAVSSVSGDGTFYTNSASVGAVVLTLGNAAQNSVWAGPASGGAGAPSYQTAPSFSGVNLTSLPLCATCANQALSNLSSVAVNSALLPGSDATISLNSASFRYVNIFASGSYAWTNGSGTADTGVSRAAAGVTAAGNGTAGNTSGTFEATAFQGVNDGVHPGQVSLPGNTTLPTLTTNTVTIIGPPSATPTAWSFQVPTAIPATGSILACVTTSTNCLVTPATSAQILAACTGCAPLASPVFTGIVTIPFPQTLTGTVNSGGIPCFNSGTNEQTSVALTVNVLIKGGGAGACPGLSLLTDNGTTATYTGTGGLAAPTFTSTGTTAGFYDLPQGTTSAAVAPCNTATSICEQAPTAVTSYLITRPGAAPNIASYKQTDGCAAASCTETFHPVPVLLTVASDFTDSTSTTLQLITGLSTTMPVSKAVVVSFHCGILFDQATAVVSDQFGIGITGTAPTQANAGGEVFITASTVTAGTLTALASTTPTSVITFTPGVATTIYRAELDGTVEQPSNATPGVLGIYVATTTGTDNIIVKRGSYCSVIYQ